MSELETHPCFTAKCSDYARIHLPVAPKCNMQCNYCLRKYSCVNESRPGVVARVMVPEDAVDWYLQMKAKVPKLTVAGIAGPGDALANWPAVSRALSMIREVDKDVFFCLSTNGLYLPKYAKEIAALGVDYVTVTVNAITSNTGAHIYSFINDEGKKYVGEEAAALLLERQIEGLQRRIRREGEDKYGGYSRREYTGNPGDCQAYGFAGSEAAEYFTDAAGGGYWLCTSCGACGRRNYAAA